MRKITLLIFVLTIFNAVHAQVIKTFTVQILNPPPCTTCCNGTIQVEVTNCGGAISCSITIPTSTLAMGGFLCMWTKLCNGVYTVGVNVGDTISCPVICNIIWGYSTPTINVTGVADKNISQFDNVELFPNPATEALNIKLTNHEESSIFARLINSTGEIVKEEILSFNKEVALLKTNILPHGIYTLELINSGQRHFRRRVLIQ
jgi:hypothetical protein